MNRVQVVLALAVMLLLGVVIGQATSSPRAEAQQGPRQWRECFAASSWDPNAAMASPGVHPPSITVPPGWIPVGGTGDRPAVVLCR